MIFFSETPIKMWQPNIIMLDLVDNLGHIYVSRGTYDQAVIVADRYNHQYDVIADKLGCPRVQEDLASYMFYLFPDPINCLAPFYNMIGKDVKIDQKNLRQAIGVLSFISMAIDFNATLTIPQKMRAGLTFTPSILYDYQRHYEDFSLSFNMSESGNNFVSQPVQTRTNTSTTTEQKVVSSNNSNTSSLKEVETYNGKSIDTKSDDFDVDAFFDSIGFDDVKVPKLSTTTSEPKQEEKKDEKGSNYTKVKTDADSYKAIIDSFV